MRRGDPTLHRKSLRLRARARRRVVVAVGIVICAWLALAGSLAAKPRPRAHHRTSRVTIIERVATPGVYVVTVLVRSGARAHNRVRIWVGSREHAAIDVSRRRSARIHVRVTLAGRKLDVRAIGQPSRPRLRVVMRRVRGLRVALPKAATPAPVVSVPVVAPVPAPVAVANPYPNLVWSDEFAGSAGSAPDPTRWRYDTGGTCGGSTPYTNTQSTANASLNGAGQLAITALHTTNGYTSAQLDTAGQYSMTYGTIAASIKLPAGAGLCSAFWMVGDGTPQPTDSCWPNCGEIDILEALSQLPTTAIFTLHGPTTNPNANSYQQYEATTNTLPDLTTAFHTYSLTWTPDTISWAIDGTTYATETKTELIATNGPAAWAFNHPFHIILDLAPGNWIQQPQPTNLPATMLIDWVHVYGP